MPGSRESIDLLRDNWRKNHRHHGGLSAAARCALGMWRLNSTTPLPEEGRNEGVDCVTFSVVPNLTALWATMMRRAIPGDRARIWVGDCSGGFSVTSPITDGVRFYPMINHLQGLKLDLFMDRFLRSEFFVVSDDDVIWLSQEPWRWAMEQFAKDPMTAVVSLVPRVRFEWELGGRKYQPMGSYCLIIRRDTWTKEGLSFQAVPKPSPSSGSYGGMFDTCDFANVELINRGYRIAIAPPEVREHLAGFKGISSAVLRIQRDPSEGYVKAFGDGPEPIVETCLVARALKPLILTLAPADYPSDLVRPELAARAQRELTPLVPGDRMREIESRVDSLTGRIAAALAESGV